MSLTKDIWKRSGENQLSIRAYAVLVGICFIWTVGMVALGTRISYDWRADFISVLIAFIGAIVGISIFSRTDKPTTSFIGVTVLSFFLGLSIGPIVAYYNTETVLQALTMTAGVTIVMSILGILAPKVIKGAGGILFVGLALLLVGYLAQFLFVILRIPVNLTFLDYIVAGLFSLYIWYDWSRALGLPYTIDNAIDAAGALILDVVNLFLALLRIFGRNR